MTPEESRRLDAEIAEKVMGESLTPDRVTAMVAIGYKWFSGSDGQGRLEIKPPNVVWSPEAVEIVVPPPAGQIPFPQKPKNINDRYMWWIANYLGDRAKAEVDAYRLEPKSYSTAWEVVGKDVCKPRIATGETALYATVCLAARAVKRIYELERSRLRSWSRRWKKLAPTTKAAPQSQGK